MKKKLVIGLFLLLLFFILNACGSANSIDNEVFKYRGSSVGDNNAVLNIIKQLPQNKAFKQLSLQTKREPYGMVLKYDDIKANNKEAVIKDTVITNATYLFALVKNAEWVTFDFNGQTYKITRTKLQNWYGKRLKEFTNEEDLKVLIQKNLNDSSKVNHFLKK